MQTFKKKQKSCNNRCLVLGPISDLKRKQYEIY